MVGLLSLAFLLPRSILTVILILLPTRSGAAFRSTPFARFPRQPPASRRFYVALVTSHDDWRRVSKGNSKPLQRRHDRCTTVGGACRASSSNIANATGNATVLAATSLPASKIVTVNDGLGTRDGDKRYATESDAPAVAPIPTYRQLIAFLSTTVLIWLSEPLLSLVDTTVVGFTSRNSVVQLAALGPATTLFDNLMYTAYFLAIATTNRLAPAFAMKRYRKLQQTTSHLLGMAALMGIVTMAVCYGAGHFALRHMVAAGPTSGVLIRYATRYVWIRASVAVASVLGMVMQAFCLSTLDTRTPALAVAVAFTVNVAGDLLLRRWGIQGAAAATAVSGLLASSILFRAVRKRLQEWRELEVEESKQAHESMQRSIKQLFVPLSNETVPFMPSNASSSSDSTRMDTAHSFNQWTPPARIPFASFPDRKSLMDLLKIAGPIFFVILAKSACYSAMTVKCADFGVLASASHCILMRVFFFYVTFGDAVSQAAQSFLPATLYPKINVSNFRALLKRLLVVASLLSVVNSNAARLILRRFGRFLSSDANIIRLMSEQSTFLAMAVLMHPFITLLEGTVVAARDFRTLVTTYAVTLSLHFTILNFACGSFPAIWRTFFLFQSIRLGNFAIQVWRNQSVFRRRELSASSPPS